MSIPKPQAYPLRLKVGDVLYSVLAYTDDGGKSHTEYEEWVVRSIKARRGTKTRMGVSLSFQGRASPMVNLTKRVKDITWVRGTGQYVWSKSISRWHRRQFDVGDDLPRSIYTTQRAALVYAIRDHEKGLKDFDRWIAESIDAGDAEELKELRHGKVSQVAELNALRIRFKKGWKK